MSGSRNSWTGEASKYIPAALFPQANSQGGRLACLQPELTGTHQNLDEAPGELLKLSGAVCF